MRTSTNWLDWLRSRLTGQPAKFYAKRRIAKADLHALEEQRARAVARLTEDIELIDRYVNPLERYMDGDRLLTPLGTILDRRSGKNLPLVWTELDLREFRRWARVICDVNPFAVGFLGLLTDFHIRQGFGWQVFSSFVARHSSFAKTTERDTGGFSRMTRDEGQGTESESQEAVHLCQMVLDDWRDTQQWGLRSREAFRRWRRDGEVFLRFFRGGRETRGLPAIRFVEPEQVGPPPGDDADGRWSFGILTDPEDVEDVQAYFVRDPLGTGSEGDEVPAHRILHLKANVDSSIKRGLPDFMPVQDDLERVRRMLRNMGEVAAIQTAIAWISQYATATVDQVGTLIRAGSDYTRPKLGDPSGKLMDVVNYEPGTVIHMDNNRQFLAGPVGTGTAGFIQVEQAILRGCGARWRFPEYFSGDASNNNMASSIVAGSPFVVAVEGNQLEWGVFERAVAKKVLELCVESGRLSREQVAGVDVKVTPPAVALANREEEERLRGMRNKAGVLSVTTWQQQVGLDPKHETANFEAEARRKGAEEGGMGGNHESKEICGCEETISETKRKETKFTGEIVDSLNRRRCYKDGKEIHCGEKSASSGERAKGSDTIGTTVDTPEMEPLQPEDPPKRLDFNSTDPEDLPKRHSVTKWTNEPKILFRKDELNYLNEHASKELSELQELGKKLLRSNPYNKSLIIEPSYLNSAEGREIVDKILKLNDKIECHLETYQIWKEINEKAGTVATIFPPAGLVAGIAELRLGHPGSAAIEALSVIPGGRLAKLLKKAPGGTKAAEEAQKLAQLEDKLRVTRKGGEEFAQIERKIATSKKDIQKKLEDAAKLNIDTFDFGKYLKGKLGDPPAGMIDPHAHHILFKKGLGQAQQAIVEEGQAILRKHGIDPIYGIENLVWAPNRIAKQHDIASLQNVVDTLKKVDAAGGDRADIVESLKKLGQLAAQRK